MSDRISSIRGVSDTLAAKMRVQGIHDVDDLLGAATKYHAREHLARKLGIGTPVLTDIVDRANLSRIRGVSTVYANLLETAGVDTIKELSHRVPAHLYVKLEAVNRSNTLTERHPSEHMVENWITQARKFDR